MGLTLDNLLTEARNPQTMELDSMTPLEIVTAMNREDARVPESIRPQLPNIAQCVAWATEAIRSGGRLIYMGAGTSGRLGRRQRHDHRAAHRTLHGRRALDWGVRCDVRRAG